MKRLVLGITLLLSLGATASATDWPVWVPKEVGRVAVATSGTTYTACTSLGITLAWSYLTCQVESVLDGNGTTQPGNAGLSLRLRKDNSLMPLQTATIASPGYDILASNQVLFEDIDMSSATLKSYYVDTTMTAAVGATTRVNLIWKTWKINRQ